MDMNKVGCEIASLRQKKGLTQSELGERFGVTFQAVSRWERGESLPDTAILVDLARVLETTVDNILLGGERLREYNGRICVADMISGIKSLRRMGEYLGRDSLIYRYAVDGINRGMNTDIEEAFTSDHAFEAFVAEAVIDGLNKGAYVDITDVKNSFTSEHFKKIVLGFCEKHGLK